MTVLKFTDELRRALRANPSGPIAVVDERTEKHYVLVSTDEYFRLHDDYVRRELQVAFDQVDHGEVGDLDMTAILAEAHRCYAARQ